MIQFDDARYITSALLSDETNVKLGKQFLALLSQANFLVEDEPSFFVGVNLGGQRSTRLFESHFAGKLDFHLD